MKEFVEAAQIISNSSKTVALTGAGISKSAGLPTFRGNSGLWNQANTLQWANRRSFDLNASAWYESFWSYYHKRKNVEPTIAHIALREMVDAKIISAIITQNIDGLDLQAGTPSSALFEIHGNDRNLHCTHCDYCVTTEAWVSINRASLVPYCPDGHALKPDILLFGDDLVPGLAAVHSAAMAALRESDTLLVVGTSLEIPYVADWVLDYVDQEKPVITVNPQRTIIDAAARLVINQTADLTLSSIKNSVAAANG
jgi:NAD-dependent deacetylase